MKTFILGLVLGVTLMVLVAVEDWLHGLWRYK